MRIAVWLLVAASVAATIGFAFGVAAARRGFTDELHDALPDAKWIGSPVLATGVYPTRVLQGFSEPSAGAAAEWLTSTWIRVARTRDGSVEAFRRDDRNLFLVYAEPPYIELVVADPCSATSASFPATPLDDWIQFGTSPSAALARLGLDAADIGIRPCVASGFWVASPSTVGVVFRGAGSNSHLSLTETSQSALGEHVFVAPRVDDARVSFTPDGVALAWKSRGIRYLYATPHLIDAKMTACLTAWPDWACSFLVH